MTTIVEVMRRSEHGATRPFICRGADGNRYFVKGRGAGRESQIKEYVCGILAQHMNLPIAPFCIVHVPRPIISGGHLADIGELGEGPAFGSLQQEMVVEIGASQVAAVPQGIAEEILLFDWWVQNGDRMLTCEGGNPNLLWDLRRESLVMIDHNLAFDTNFNVQNYINLHVFHNLIRNVFEDLVARVIFTERLNYALTAFGQACDNLPEEWLDEAPAWFGLDKLKSVLERCNRNDFWNLA